MDDQSEQEWAPSWGSEVSETLVLGYPCPVFVNRRRRLEEVLLDSHRFADREYLVEGQRRLTFAAHLAAVESVTTLLQSVGVTPGDRVLLFAANSVEWVVSFWSILRAGGVVVLGNAWWSESELEHALQTVQPQLVVCDSQREYLLPSRQRRTSIDDVAASMSVSSPTESSSSLTGVEDDPAVVLFTSGTTGLAKGAVLSHRGIISTLQSLLLRTGRLPMLGSAMPPPSKALLSLPLFHIGGLQQIITPHIGGGTIVFSEGRFDPQRIVKLIEEEQVTVWSAVPTMVTRVADYLEQGNHQPLSTVRTIGMGGSPVAEQLRDRVRIWFPSAVRGLAVTYGLSEACGVVSTGAGAEIREHPGTVGRPLPSVLIHISEPDEHGVGEVLVRSPSVMLGYWVPGADQGGGALDPGPVSDDRWLHTGDIGRVDDNGFLFITDRSKDIVIRGGENIATPLVESRLIEHPAVREVAVVGLPHPTFGEELGAIVVLHPGEVVTEAELTEFAGMKLAYFEIPTKWKFRSELLPQNDTGKILKRSLRDEWAEQLTANLRTS